MIAGGTLAGSAHTQVHIGDHMRCHLNLIVIMTAKKIVP